jgi:hypothetical protein
MRKRAVLSVVLLLAATAVSARPVGPADSPLDLGEQDDGVPRRERYTGLSVMAGAGAYWADDVTANFYSGKPENANTISRVLYSNTYGQRIWENLTTAGLISSAVGSYNELKVVEYPEMYYRTSYQVGVGIRYDYRSGFGWLMRFDLGRLQAIGAFNLSSTNGTGILTDNHQYIRCGVLGKEDRINIDFALTRTVELGGNLCLELDLGASLTNTKVKENLIEVNGATYSILDVWGGHSPDYGVGSYEYVNQGGIGWGVFMSGLLGYHIDGVGALKAGYTCHHSKTTLEGYTAMGWQHCITIRIEINNFSFL